MGAQRTQTRRSGGAALTGRCSRLALLVTGLWLTAQVQALPLLDITESVGGGIGEYTVDIQSPIGETWWVVLFAAENEQSALAGGDGAFVDNGIGEWTGQRFAPNQWQAGFEFEFDTPGGPESLGNTNDFGDFTDLFGADTFAHAYWPTSYLDFSAGNTFSLIGPNESRGGFKFHSPIVASNWMALVRNDLGDETLLRGAVPEPPQAVHEPASLALLAFGTLGLAAVRRRQRRLIRPHG